MDLSDDDDEFVGWGRLNPVRHQNEKDRHFMKIQQGVTEEENKLVTLEDQERLFSKISYYLKKPFAPLGILTLQKLAFIPPTVSADRLRELAKIICRYVFNSLSVTEDYIREYVDFCKGFAYLKGTSNNGVVISFEEILIEVFLNELSKKFGYSQRLQNLLKNRDIPQEKKQKWLEKQIEEQQRIFNIITLKSVHFLDKLNQLYPEIVYRVIEHLLKSHEEDGFQYLCALLGLVRYRSGSEDHAREIVLTDMYKMKTTYWERYQNDVFLRPPGPPLPIARKNLTPLFESITRLSHQHYRLTADMRDTIEIQIIHGNAMKENSPQDYIKYSIKDCLLSEKFILEDDFHIDDEDKYDCNIYTLRSRNLTTNVAGIRPFPAIFWNGLKVKILTKKSKGKPVRRPRFGLRPA